MAKAKFDPKTASIGTLVWKLEKWVVIPIAVVIAIITTLYTLSIGGYVVSNVGNSGGAGTFALVMTGIVAFITTAFVWTFILSIAFIMGLVLWSVFGRKQTGPASGTKPVANSAEEEPPSSDPVL